MAVTVTLARHPESRSDAIREVLAEVDQSRPDLVTLRYTICGEVAELAIPPPAEPRRAARLWERTCFELFVRSSAGNGYDEFNFSPSEEWAAYEFSGYRQGMAPAPMAHEPVISFSDPPGSFELHVSLPIRLPRSGYLGLSAILEEKSGNKSHWAIRHPPGEPDFHHPDCFALELPAARPA